MREEKTKQTGRKGCRQRQKLKRVAVSAGTRECLEKGKEKGEQKTKWMKEARTIADRKT